MHTLRRTHGLLPPLRRSLNPTPRVHLRPRTRLSSTHTPPSSAPPPTQPSLDPIEAHRLQTTLRAHYLRRTYYAAFGAVTCMVATLYIASYAPPPSQSKSALQNDSLPSDPLHNLQSSTPLTTVPSSDPAPPIELVQTGTSTIPTFPKTIHLPAPDESRTEYQLLGLGIRTVSFLSIQVYVVGLYVARDDVAALQAGLIHAINAQASTLIPSEAEALKAKLLDGTASEEVWNAVLKERGVRTAFRVVPTRNADFGHLRDGWVRSITARTQAAARKTGKAAEEEEGFEDEGFAQAMAGFKALFAANNPSGKKGVPRGKTLLLVRDAGGRLGVWYDDRAEAGSGEKKDEEEKGALLRVGEVADERVSRLLWLGYLAGKSPASEGARKSVVDGVGVLVGRPVGTVVGQVV